ncbi:MAG: dual specificity protein phosphatase family protein [Myxococcaceae bacterium]|nr:dual specificity protein phosphatase family protein [Myxococcaceae bacterium]
MNVTSPRPASVVVPRAAPAARASAAHDGGFLHDVGHFFDHLKDEFENAGGRLIGEIEKLGIRFPVEHYKAQVSPGLWRGSRLDDRGWAELKAMGIKATVDLRAEESGEPEVAAKYGIRTLRIPITDNTAPTTGQVKTFLDFVTRPENQPAYVHCEAGVGRTGVMVAAYRMAVQGWSADEAIAEAKQLGLSMPSQKDFLRRFARDLAAGRIEGYGKAA